MMTLGDGKAGVRAKGKGHGGVESKTRRRQQTKGGEGRPRSGAERCH